MRQLLAETGSAELAEWRAYEQITGPLGGARGDIQAALIASVIAAVNRGKGQRAPEVSEFMPRWDRTQTRKTPEELFRLAMAANSSLGGRVNTTPA
ncbi:DUF4035 domain-containing protein [Streptomyces glaucescens]|uniref:phage tail assembly protein T n=1 Tax=Streptomyces glaucescens TaxID=1907 RepID=UPI00344BE204